MQRNNKYAVITSSGDYTKEGEKVIIQWFDSLTVAYKYWLKTDQTNSMVVKFVEPKVIE